MKSFKVGDYVRSVEKLKGYLTYGKIYVIKNITDYSGDLRFELIDDSGLPSYYYSYRFELDVQTMREKCINEILE